MHSLSSMSVVIVAPPSRRRVSVGELARRARISDKAMRAALKRMSEWWGCLVVRADAGDTRAKPPRSAWVVRPTRHGRRAPAVWQPLVGAIEGRWRARLGGEEIDRLREALCATADLVTVDLPD